MMQIAALRGSAAGSHRAALSCVRWKVLVRCTALAAAIATACGGGKKSDTTPAPGAAAAGGAGGQAVGAGPRPEDIDPEGPIPDAAGGGGSGAGDAGDAAGGRDAGGADVAGGDAAGGDGAPGGADAGEPARIEPPGLDIPPEEKARRVAAHMQNADAALAARRWDDAVDAARKALEVDEVHVPAMVALAHAYYGKGYYDKAEAILDIALKRPDGPSNAKAHFLLGLVYEKTDRPDEALAAYERAVQADPSYRPALINLGAKYLERERYADAVRIYEKLTGELGDNSALAWSNLGAAYRGRSAEVVTDRAQRNELLKKAEMAYKRAITADSKYAPAYYNLGLLYLDADPFPAPDGSDMDTLKRLERAKTYFNEYRGMPGANHALVDEQVAVVDKLYAREQKIREKRRKLEERRRKREERKRKEAEAAGGDG